MCLLTDFILFHKCFPRFLKFLHKLRWAGWYMWSYGETISFLALPHLFFTKSTIQMNKTINYLSAQHTYFASFIIYLVLKITLYARQSRELSFYRNRSSPHRRKPSRLCSTSCIRRLGVPASQLSFGLPLASPPAPANTTKHWIIGFYIVCLS